MSEETDKIMLMMKELMSERGNSDEGRDSSRSRVEIESISIPVKVYDRGKSLRVYLNLKATVRDERDILRIAEMLYDMRLDPDFYEKKEYRGGSNYNNNSGGYDRGGNYNRRR